MPQRPLFSPNAKTAFRAMCYTWIIVSVGSFVAMGEYNHVVDFFAITVYFALFMFVTWFAFLWPILGLLQKIIDRKDLRLLLPVVMGIYGIFIFVLLFSLLVGDFTLWHDFLFEGPTSLTIIAGSSGFVWGGVYLYLKQQQSTSE